MLDGEEVTPIKKTKLARDVDWQALARAKRDGIKPPQTIEERRAMIATKRAASNARFKKAEAARAKVIASIVDANAKKAKASKGP